MDGGAKGQQKPRSGNKVMKPPPEQPAPDWLVHRAFGGLDWASQKHNVIVVDPHGKVVEDFQIEHSALGWKKFRERL